MQKKYLLGLATLAALLLFGFNFASTSSGHIVSAAAGINHQINFQGKLVSPDGTNVTDGSYSVVFSIYNVASGGSAIWTETQTVAVSNGIFQVNLGSVTPLPGSVDFNTDNIYLGIKVGSDAEMTPRIQFTAVPQAFNAEKLGGLDKTDFIQNTTSPQTANFDITGSGTIGTNLTVGGTTSTSSITIGSTGSVTGSIAFKGSTAASGTITFTLATNNPNSYTLQLPNSAAGTYTVCTSDVNSCGGTSGTYIALQGSTPGSQQTGNFNISGRGLLGSLEVGSSQQLQVDSSGNLTTTGTSLVKTNSTSAFQVQNASSTSILNVNTQNSSITISGGQSANWTVRTAPGGYWGAVAYGNGTYVAVEQGSPYVMTSPDGVNWTTQTALAGYWQSVTYANGLFVAVSEGGPTSYVMTSPDGVNWTARTAPAGDWASVTYGNGQFVAVNNWSSPSVMTSPDGITWTAQTAPEGGWYSVTYGNGTFVAVANGDSPYIVMTSPDGVNWTTQSAPTGYWYSVTYGNGLFVAVGDNSPYLMTSPDGINWTGRTVPDGSWQSVTYANGLFVAVANYSSYSVLTSPDGITWTAQANPQDGWNAVTYGNGTFVAVGSGSDYAMTSTSPAGALALNTSGGQTTDTLTVTGNNSAALQVSGGSMLNGDLTVDGTTTAHGQVVLQNYVDSTDSFQIQDANTNVLFNADTANHQISISGGTTASQITFVTHTVPNAQWTSVAYGNGTFVAVDNNSTSSFMSSTDGSTWTSRTASYGSWDAVTYGNGLFVAVNRDPGTGTHVMTSPDGINWTAQTAPSGQWYSMTYGNGKFVAVSSTSPYVMTSTNGVGWSTQSAPTGNWYSVTYANGLFVAVANGGPTSYVMTSPDGSTWTARTAPTGNWYSVTYGAGTFVAVADGSLGSSAMTSPDGITWTPQTATGSYWRDVTYGNGTFVAISNNTAMTSPDGVTWTDLVVPNGTWQAITYGNGTFVATAQGSVMVGVPSGGLAALQISGGAYSDSLSLGEGGKPVTSNVKLQVYGDSNMQGSLTVAKTSSTAFQVQNAGGSSTLLNADTSGSTVTVNGATILQPLSDSRPLGPELMTSTTSFSAAAGWTSISGTGQSATATHNGAIGDTTTIVTSPAISLVAGQLYHLSFTVSGTTSSYVKIMAGSTMIGPFGYISGTINKTFTAPASGSLGFAPSGATFDGTISNVSLKQYTNGTAPAALTINSASGSAAIEFRTAGDPSNIFIGLGSGQNTTPDMNSIVGVENTAVGTNTLQGNTTGAANSAFGTYSLESNITGASNNAFGAYALQNNTTGNSNNAFGAYALQDSTTSYSNNAFGAYALTSNTLGNENSAFGDSALIGNTTGYDNTANGAYALSNNIDGSENTGVGEYALNNSNSGSQNVGIGGFALGTNTTGNGNTGLGYFADVGANNLQNSTAIGAYSYVTQSDSLVLGCVSGTNGCTTSTKVGIGTTAPTALLQVKGSSSSAFNIQDGGGVDLLNANTTDSVVTVAGGQPSNWTARTAPGHGYNSVAYGNGMFVAVSYGYSPAVITSPDGTTWTSQTATTGSWTYVTYANGMFVAVGTTSPYVMTSTNGTTWTNGSGVPAGSWYSVTYGNGMFVAVSYGSSNQVMTSTDGINWTVRTAQTSNWHSVTYGNGMFMAVSQSSPYFMTSTDGINWTSYGHPAGTWNSVTYADGKFVAVNGDATATYHAMYSTDGINWYMETASPATWRSVTYADNMFVVVGYNSLFVMTSPDGINWTSQTVSPGNVWQSVTYGAGTFVAVGSNYTSPVMSSTNPAAIPALEVNGNSTVMGNMGVGTTNPKYNVDIQGSTGLRVQTTTNTTTALQIQNSSGASLINADTKNQQITIAGGNTTPALEPITTSALSSNWNSIAYGNSRFVAVSSSNPYVMTSPDGITWTSGTAPTSAWASVTYGNSRFVAVSSSSPYVMTSPDGITWTTRTATVGDWKSVTYGNGLFVAVSYDTSPYVMTSPDGITWTGRTTPTTTSRWKSVTYGNGLFVAVGNWVDSSNYVHGAVMTSPDGITWTTRTTPDDSSDLWGAVAFGDNEFVIVSNGDINVETSPDGINWTSHTTFVSGVPSWNSLTYGNGTFMAVGNEYPSNSDIMFSTDGGSTWTEQEESYEGWQGVAYGNSGFAVVGDIDGSDALFIPADGGTTALTVSGGTLTDTLSIGGGAKPADINTKLQVYGNSTVNGSLLVSGSTTAGSSENPLQTVDTSAVSTSAAAYTMGYSFTPSVNGSVTQLGVRCTAGSYTLTLWTSTGTQLATATGTATGTTSWAYTNITPVSLTAGTTYVVSEYSASNYCYNTFTTPVTTGHITITNSIYSSGTAFPATTNTTTMYGQADITFVPSTNYSAIFSSNVGIGTTAPGYMLDVQGTQNSSYIMNISNNSTQNTADGLLINLGATTSTRSTGNYYLGFAAAGTIAGKIQGNGSSVLYTTSGADYAEYFKADPNNLPQEGELLTFDTSNPKAVTRAANGQAPLVGVVSTDPGFVGNGPVCNADDKNCDQDYAKYNVLVALNGQVPVKVSTENGPIAIGDPIAVSDTAPGVGVKATGAGYIVGYALEPATKDGTIKVLIRPSFYSAANDLQGSNAIFNQLTITGSMTADSINVGGLATLGSLTVTGDATFQGDIIVSGNATFGGHLITTGSTPTTQVLTAAGSQGTGATIEGNDISGALTVTTGTNATLGDLLKLSFAKAYSKAPHVMITPDDAASAALLVYASSSSTASFNLSVATQPQANTTYSFTYYVVQ